MSTRTRFFRGRPISGVRPVSGQAMPGWSARPEDNSRTTERQEEDKSPATEPGQSSGARPVSVASSFCFLPQTVWTHFGVLTVVVKQLCLDRCAVRACTANSLLFTIHSCLSTCLSTAQGHEIWVAAAGACRDCALVVAPRAFSHMVIALHGRRKGNLVFRWFNLDFS